jgi:hypothetical protein
MAHFQVGARAIFLAYALALACTPEDGPAAEDEESSTETGEESSTETGEESSTETGELVCRDESSSYTGDVAPPIDCMLESPCPSVVFPYKAFECTSTDYDDVAAACVIDALRAGTPSFHFLRDCPLNKGFFETRLQVFDDGTVLYYELEYTCGEPSGYRETWRTLPDPAYFDACDITTGAGFGACIEGLLDQPCVLGEPSCP